MEISKATVVDAKAISELISPLVVKYILPTCSGDGVKILLESMNAQSITGYIESGYCYFKAIEQDELIAVIGVRDNSHLYHLFVNENYQGKGIAATLWAVAMKESLSQGNSGVFTVNSAVNAAGLYRKLGFIEQSGIRERGGIKDIPMQLTIPNTVG